MAGLLSMSYQSNLLASLLKVGLVPPLDTFGDIYEAGLAVYLPRGTAGPAMLSSYPSDITRKLYQEAVVERNGIYQPQGNTFPPHLAEEVLDGKAAIMVLSRNYYGMRHMFRRGSGLTFARFYMGYYQV